MYLLTGVIIVVVRTCTANCCFWLLWFIFQFVIGNYGKIFSKNMSAICNIYRKR